MKQHTINEVEPLITQPMRTKSMERECPRCEAVLVQNDNEHCYECLTCGFIDCGEDH